MYLNGITCSAFFFSFLHLRQTMLPMEKGWSWLPQLHLVNDATGWKVQMRKSFSPTNVTPEMTQGTRSGTSSTPVANFFKSYTPITKCF